MIIDASVRQDQYKVVHNFQMDRILTSVTETAAIEWIEIY